MPAVDYFTTAGSGTSVLSKLRCDCAQKQVIQSFPVEVVRRHMCKDQTLADIRMMLEGVVDGGSGKNAASKHFKVAGKTGTAEQTSSRPNHALFVGYAPYETPEIAIATRIPFGYSSDYAAQATRDVVKYYYGLADDLINGKADNPDAGASNER